MLSGDTGAYARVYAQTSLDGRSWEDSDQGQGGLVSAGINLQTNPSGAVVPYYLGMSPGAAFVRFGVQISNGDEAPYLSGPVAMRLTLVATPRYGGGEVVFAYEQATNSVSLNDTVGPVLRTVELERLSLVAESSAFTSTPPESISFQVFTGPSPSGPWIALAGTVTVDANNTEAFLSTTKDLWSTYLQVQVSALQDATASSKFSLTGTVWKSC